VTADSRRARFNAERQSPQSFERRGAGRLQIAHFALDADVVAMGYRGVKLAKSAAPRI
jgi:hypothetical protein